MLVTPPPPEYMMSPPCPKGNIILIFYANVEPSTGQMWDQNCRMVDSTIRWLFGGEDKPLAYVAYVGSRTEWKVAHNRFRQDYGLQSIPAMLRFKNGREVARLDGNGMLDTRSLGAFLS